MKANKALKRLAKIEALMADVTERYSASAPHLREVLQDAKAAITRAKEAVSVQSFSGRAKTPPAKHAKPPLQATPEPAKPKRRLSTEGMKRIVAATKKRWALKRAEAANPPAAQKQAAPAANASSAGKKFAVKKTAVKAAKKAPKKVAVKKAAPVTNPGAEAAGLSDSPVVG